MGFASFRIPGVPPMLFSLQVLASTYSGSCPGFRDAAAFFPWLIHLVSLFSCFQRSIFGIVVHFDSLFPVNSYSGEWGLESYSLFFHRFLNVCIMIAFFELFRLGNCGRSRFNCRLSVFFLPRFPQNQFFHFKL